MTSLIDVALRMATNAAVIEKSLSSRGLALPSFDQNAGENFPDVSKDDAASEARVKLMDDSKLLLDLLLGPADLINRLCQSVCSLCHYQFIYTSNNRVD